MHKAIQRAVDDNLIVLAAAGNCVGTVVWPARLNECIAVAGCNVRDEPWQGTSRGTDVDITAPGELVWRAEADLLHQVTDKVSGGQGTSFAVAVTAGVAALWLAHHGRSTLVASLKQNETLQDRFRTLLNQTSRRREDGTWFEGMGHGIVDAEQLVKTDPMPPPADAIELEISRNDNHSLMSLLDEVAGPVAMERTLDEAVPGTQPPSFDLDKFGAEISYLALSKQWRRRVAARMQTGDTVEIASDARHPEPSEMLRQAIGQKADARLQVVID